MPLNGAKIIYKLTVDHTNQIFSSYFIILTLNGRKNTNPSIGSIGLLLQLEHAIPNQDMPEICQLIPFPFLTQTLTVFTANDSEKYLYAGGYKYNLYIQICITIYFLTVILHHKYLLACGCISLRGNNSSVYIQEFCEKKGNKKDKDKVISKDRLDK